MISFHSNLERLSEHSIWTNNNSAAIEWFQRCVSFCLITMQCVVNVLHDWKEEYLCLRRRNMRVASTKKVPKSLEIRSSSCRIFFFLIVVQFVENFAGSHKTPRLGDSMSAEKEEKEEKVTKQIHRIVWRRLRHSVCELVRTDLN